MTTLKTQLNPRSPLTFQANVAAMERVSLPISMKRLKKSPSVARKWRGRNIWRAANCCRASGSAACSIPVRPSLRSASSPPMACMAGMCRRLR